MNWTQLQTNKFFSELLQLDFAVKCRPDRWKKANFLLCTFGLYNFLISPSTLPEYTGICQAYRVALLIFATARLEYRAGPALPSELRYGQRFRRGIIDAAHDRHSAMFDYQPQDSVQVLKRIIFRPKIPVFKLAALPDSDRRSEIARIASLSLKIARQWQDSNAIAALSLQFYYIFFAE